MSNYVLTCCSTADVSEKYLQSRDVKYVYFNYELDGVQCKDDFGRTNAPADLYKRCLQVLSAALHRYQLVSTWPSGVLSWRKAKTFFMFR